MKKLVFYITSAELFYSEFIVNFLLLANCSFYYNFVVSYMASLVAQTVKNPPAMQEPWVQSLGWEDPLQEGVTTCPVFLPGESSRTEVPGGLQSMGSQGVRHDWATQHSAQHGVVDPGLDPVRSVLPAVMWWFPIPLFPCPTVYNSSDPEGSWFLPL